MSDKTYSEACGRETFDWNQALEEAIQNQWPRYSKEQTELSCRAGSWIMCACGNQCAIIPRHFGGLPEDDLLASLGADFSLRIDLAEYEIAKAILAQIEVRSAELIAIELSKRNQQPTK